jgi:Transposase
LFEPTGSLHHPIEGCAVGCGDRFRAGGRRVAADHGVAWWTVQATLNAAAVLLPDIDQLQVRRLGVDAHRYRRVRCFRDEDGGWRRVEPWMSTMVNADSGQVLGIVDGRDSAAVGGWLAARSPAWRNRIQVVAIDPSAAFKKAILAQLPNAKISVDPFHVVQLAKPDGHPGTAAADPGAKAAPRPQDQPGVGTSDTSAAWLRHIVGAGPGLVGDSV